MIQDILTPLYFSYNEERIFLASKKLEKAQRGSEFLPPERACRCKSRMPKQFHFGQIRPTPLESVVS